MQSGGWPCGSGFSYLVAALLKVTSLWDLLEWNTPYATTFFLNE
jgi:hypothetical protein